MAYILTKDRPENSYEEWQAAWAAYCAYLASIKDVLPEGAYDFATASWHYNFEDHRSPHDSWLETLLIREPSTGERRQYRSVEIMLQLLGAYHDGFIEIKYLDVQRYSLIKISDGSGHRDWLYDEVRLSEQRNVLHEIEWSQGNNWLIEAKEMTYKWTPNV